MILAMSDKFVVRAKQHNENEGSSVVMTIRMDRAIKEAFDELSSKSNRSRNELMCMALSFALKQLQFIDNDSN